MTPAEGHQMELERRRQEEESFRIKSWQALLDSDLAYLRWSERLRDESEQQQAQEHK